MGFLDRYRRRQRQRSNDLEIAQRSFERLFKQGLEHLALRDAVTSPYEQVDTVYIAVSAISTSVSSVEYGVTSRGAEDESFLPDHPIMPLMQSPNDEMVGSQLIEGTTVSLELSGRAFWLLDGMARSSPNSPQAPTRIHLLPADTKAKVSRAGDLVSWSWKDRNGSNQSAGADEVVPFAYYHPNPQQPFDGMAPLRAARLGYSLQWKSSRFQELFYEHGAFPPFYVYTPPEATLGKDERRNLRDRFREMYLSLKNAWVPPILGQGAELRGFSINQRDMEWIEGHKLTRENILAIFGTPPAVVGFMETANRANSVEQKRFFWTRTLPPKLHLMKSVIDARMLSRFWPDAEWKFALKARLAEAIPEDIRDSISAAGELISHGVPPSTAYAFLGLDIDTSNAPWLDQGWLPFNVVPAGSIAADNETGVQGAGFRSKKVETRWRAHVWKKFESEFNTLERNYLGAFRGFMDWFEKETTDNIKSLEDLPAITEMLTRAATPTADQIAKQLKRSLSGPIQQSIKGGWTSVLDELGAKGEFDPSSPIVQSMLKLRLASVQSAVGTMKSRLHAEIKAGREAGESDAEIRRRVREFVRTYKAGQAKVVARTETVSAFNQTRFATMKEHGVKKHQWLSARDNDVRDSHSEEDGNTVSIGKPFPVTGLKFPNDPDGDPEEIINCRCVSLMAD